MNAVSSWADMLRGIRAANRDRVKWRVIIGEGTMPIT